MYRVVIWGVFFIFLFLSGCGKKAPPVYSNAYMPKAVLLEFYIKDEVVTLSFTPDYFGETSSGSLEGYIIYKSSSLSNAETCENCPVVFKKAGTVYLRNRQKKAVYREKMEKGYKYHYKVAGFSSNGIFSDDSNIILFEY